MKGPKSSIGTESMVLNNWITRIIFRLVLKIFLFVSVSNLIRWLLLFVVHSSVMSSLLRQSPESSISSKSVVLNDWIGRIVLMLVLEVFLFISVGYLIRWLSMMFSMMSSDEHIVAIVVGEMSA